MSVQSNPAFVLPLSLLERMALAVYGLLMRLLQPWVRRRHRRRGRAEPGYLQHMEQRFGHYPGLAASSGWVWIHAVSLGETRAAALLLAALREQVPGLRLLLTHGTATGRAEGAKLLRPGDLQVWQPWDTPAAVQRFLQQFRPALGVLLETEVWPHWVQGCRAHSVPLLLVNARLNPKSLRAAQRLRCLMRPAYAGLSAVLAQTEADAARLRAIGAHAVQVLGNLKFDLSPDPVQIERGRRWRAALGGRRVVMLASSREGEEALWLQALRQAQDVPSDPKAPLWLVVPRHPQRFDAVAALLQQAGLSVFRRSQWPEGLAAADAAGAAGAADCATAATANPAAAAAVRAAAPATARSAQVWLGDSLGEMHAYYAMADLAWLGGSFLPLGGQNLIEAAACGCPVLMGPHTYNFHDAAEQALHCGAAQRVPDMAAALPATRHWLDDAAALQRARLGCAALLQQGQGAARRSAALLCAALAPAATPSA